MWKPYGTVRPEVVENRKMGTLRCSNINSAAAAAALLLYPCGIRDNYTCSVKCLPERCLWLSFISNDCANKVYILFSPFRILFQQKRKCLVATQLLHTYIMTVRINIHLQYLTLLNCYECYLCI